MRVGAGVIRRSGPESTKTAVPSLSPQTSGLCAVPSARIERDTGSPRYGGPWNESGNGIARIVFDSVPS